ncbi:hypothetical protein SBRY_30303 [Actinacidiphila bryophytorum]|uniref:Uncharacterized protein n=1 Tax=Actinacidiphila bryophytorum TaxID=1436133 RepID=A0A9W4MB67_9ACTN|nr:hypothetical protein SBRY_30303 [Actinacidiphila bryophytorum]
MAAPRGIAGVRQSGPAGGVGAAWTVRGGSRPAGRAGAHTLSWPAGSLPSLDSYRVMGEHSASDVHKIGNRRGGGRRRAGAEQLQQRRQRRGEEADGHQQRERDGRAADAVRVHLRGAGADGHGHDAGGVGGERRRDADRGRRVARDAGHHEGAAGPRQGQGGPDEYASVRRGIHRPGRHRADTDLYGRRHRAHHRARGARRRRQDAHRAVDRRHDRRLLAHRAAQQLTPRRATRRGGGKAGGKPELCVPVVSLPRYRCVAVAGLPKLLLHSWPCCASVPRAGRRPAEVLRIRGG